MTIACTITPTPPTAIQVRRGQEGKLSFTVTSLAAPDTDRGVLLQALLIGADGKNKEVDWLIVGPKRSLNLSGGETVTVTITAKPMADSARGEHNIRLVIADRDRPNDEYVYSAPVVCEVLDEVREPPKQRRLPWWLIPAIAGGVLLVAGSALTIWWLWPSRPTLGEPCDPDDGCADGLLCVRDARKCLLAGGASCTQAHADLCASGECKSMSTAEVCAIPLGGTCDPHGQNAQLCPTRSTCNPATKTCVTTQCQPGSQMCGDRCVDLATDPKHCGGCDRTCGADSACAQGECQPAVVAKDLDGPMQLAITQDTIYWSERTRIASCPLPQGCTLAPRPIADTYQRLGLLAVAGGSVHFTGCRGDSCDDLHRLFVCPIAGCPATTSGVASTSSTFVDLVAGSTSVYLRGSSGTDLFWCRIGRCRDTLHRFPTILFGEVVGLAVDGGRAYIAGAGSIWTCSEESCDLPVLAFNARLGRGFRIHAERAYWFQAGGPNPRLLSCGLDSCNSPGTFAVDVPGVSDLEVDDTGVYWVNTQEGYIRHCPLSGCVGGGAQLAKRRTSPKGLTLGPGFVYWIEGNNIVKVARP